MHETILTGSKTNFPLPADPDTAALGWERLCDPGETGDSADFFAALRSKDAVRRALDAVLGNSPFLSHCVIAEPDQLRHLLEHGPDSAFNTARKTLDETLAGGAGEADVARALRLAKRRVALCIALADIWSLWGLEQVTTALSDFAASAIAHAARHALAEAATAGTFRLKNADDPERDSGYVILAMGKLGAGELNYSSDIDLITLFDRDSIDTDDVDRLQNRIVRMTRTMARLLDERTVDGYVFRTDLRLRPDPASTPLALSVVAAETYYESVGQNWERAAMIKARAIAGDIAAGERFLTHLTPFIWRKSLDFAAIQDIHSIKRQIHARSSGRSGSGIQARGHNIKTGIGGIREIEFFVQTQQLIWGGREPTLRTRPTLETLDTLVANGHTAEAQARDLAGAYRFLRRVEHRLQMIDDEQTQTLPTDNAGFRRLALFLGYQDPESFESELLATLKTVSEHYANLYGDAPSLGTDAGNLMFTGIEADPETLQTLASLGFKEPATVEAAVRGWHHGRTRATRSTRAREILTELMPVLLSALGRQPDAAAAFARFDAFVTHLPSGVQLFSLFQAAPQLLDLVADIMGEAPRLAEQLSRRPSMLDTVLEPDFMQAPPNRDELLAELMQALTGASYLEVALDAARRWNYDRRFQVGVQVLRGRIPPDDAAVALSNIADVALEVLYPVVEAEFQQQHGQIAGGEIAVLALGKLGSRELTATSDLDMVFVYRNPEGVEASDGAKPLPPSTYHSRLAGRFITALSALTAEGTMYDIDMRLRPNGKASTAATPFDLFHTYYAEEAWTWEYMALCRARVIFGAPALVADLRSEVETALRMKRDQDRLLFDVASMRRRMDGEHHTECPWSLKYVRGGLVDIDFIAQYLTLAHGRDQPTLLAGNTRRALEAARAAGLLDDDDGGVLIEAHDLWRALQGLLALTLDGDIKVGQDETFPEALKEDLARDGHADNFEHLAARVTMLAAQVHAIYARIIDDPAAALPPIDLATDPEDMSGHLPP